MPVYHSLGEIPHKRHTQFKQPDGSLYKEHLMGNLGFSGIASLLYHVHEPTRMLSSRTVFELKWPIAADKALRPRHFLCGRVAVAESTVLGRTPFLFNNDVAMSIVHPTKTDDFFYRNAQGDELVYVAEGAGTLESMFGELPYRRGDYVIIPRGIIHRFKLGSAPHRFMVLESEGYIRTPRRYRNEHGQLMEHSPFCERDIRKPSALPLHEEKGEFSVYTKRENSITEVVLDHHPLDVAGWDGYYYPWVLNIEDFEPIVGRVHQPPPVHQTFESDGFVVCSFVPRLYDFHPLAVPVPYNHSNAMSDEVIYYAKDKFMSRRGVEFGSVTLHPDGVPHGPHPGTVEAALGAKETTELAVMFDTFRPLKIAAAAEEYEDKNYYKSWVE